MQGGCPTAGEGEAGFSPSKSTTGAGKAYDFVMVRSTSPSFVLERNVTIDSTCCTQLTDVASFRILCNECRLLSRRVLHPYPPHHSYVYSNHIHLTILALVIRASLTISCLVFPR